MYPSRCSETNLLGPQSLAVPLSTALAWELALAAYRQLLTGAPVAVLGALQLPPESLVVILKPLEELAAEGRRKGELGARKAAPG